MKFLFTLLLISFSLLAQEPDSIPKPDLRLALWPDRQLLDKTDDKFVYKEKSKIWLIKKVTRPAIALYKASNATANAPAVLICPGGAYNVLAYDHEGTNVATWLNSFGIHAIVLKYTVPGNQRAAALRDAQRAMGIVRSNAASWGINPNKIGILGFSAGAHLSAHLSTNYQTRKYKHLDANDKTSCRPDFTV
ncbi:MAG: alpha/beta hydrolase [Lentisphaeraceae bacterium]|nr:alpha/beta hydrolase [Lentisphaeraceae bacterium]